MRGGKTTKYVIDIATATMELQHETLRDAEGNPIAAVGFEGSRFHSMAFILDSSANADSKGSQPASQSANNGDDSADVDVIIRGKRMDGRVIECRGDLTERSYRGITLHDRTELPTEMAVALERLGYTTVLSSSSEEGRKDLQTDSQSTNREVEPDGDEDD